MHKVLISVIVIVVVDSHTKEMRLQLKRKSGTELHTSHVQFRPASYIIQELTIVFMILIVSRISSCSGFVSA